MDRNTDACAAGSFLGWRSARWARSSWTESRRFAQRWMRYVRRIIYWKRCWNTRGSWSSRWWCRGLRCVRYLEARWPAFGRRTIVTLGLVALVVYGAGRVIFPISERAFLPYRPPILSLSSASVERLTAGETATVRVDLVAMQELPAPLGYSLQLTDPITEQVWATADQWSALEANCGLSTNRSHRIFRCQYRKMFRPTKRSG